MKKTLLLLVFMLATVFAADAQTRFGVKVGANYSGFEGDDSEDLDRLFGFHGGVMASVPVVEDFFFIHPEILFSKKGAETSDDRVKFKISYIDVPVLAHIHAGPLFFEVGPQVSFRVGGDIEVNDVNVDDDLDQFKRTSLGYAAGLGLASMPMGLTLGLRYNGDISKLYDDDSISDARNSVFMLSLGYMFTSR